MYSNNSLKGYIMGFIRGKYPEYVSKGEVDDYARRAGFLAENAGRRCRELVKAGRLEMKLEKGKSGVRYSIYKWIPPKIETEEEHIENLARQGTFG